MIIRLNHMNANMRCRTNRRQRDLLVGKFPSSSFVRAEQRLAAGPLFTQLRPATQWAVVKCGMGGAEGRFDENRVLRMARTKGPLETLNRKFICSPELPIRGRALKINRDDEWETCP